MRKKITKMYASMLIVCLGTSILAPSTIRTVEASPAINRVQSSLGISTMSNDIVFDSNDYIVTRETGIVRGIPKTTGKYSVNDYPIPNVNKVPSEEVFELIKAENKELMDQVEADIKAGTLKKHIAAYRNENGIDEGWNKVTDPFSSLRTLMDDKKNEYSTKTNDTPWIYSTFIHEIGTKNFADVITSIYKGGTYNGIELAKYDFKVEKGVSYSEGRFDDIAYRICVLGKADFTWYMTEVLNWPLTNDTIAKIKKLGYGKKIPVQNVYAMGESEQETGHSLYQSVVIHLILRKRQ